MINLRTYQIEAIDNLYFWFSKNAEGNPLLVLPTGSGKSLIQAKICEDALKWPNQRILCMSHVQELISQNFNTLLKLWPEAPAGIYCAGLDRKQHQHKIVIGSIQSIYKKANLIGWRDLIIIDEAHLLGDSDTGMYRQFLSHMKSINPDVKIIGMSATPYRMKSGYLHQGEGALFSDIAYEVPITRLIKEGCLCPLTSRAAEHHVKTNNLGIQGGEFAIKEMITAIDKEEMTKAAVEEMFTCGHDKKSWLIFCVSIEHAEHVRNTLENRGIESAMVCDKTPKSERAKILADFKAGRLRAVTNVSVLTTGFDAPNIDMLVFLRPTMSPGLLVQMAGRGMRPVYAPGHDLSTAEGRLAAIAAGPKPKCLVLDMAECLVRHGPITHITPEAGGSRKDKRQREGKMCNKCRSVNHFKAMECVECGAPFEGMPRAIKHALRASSAKVMSDEAHISDVPQWFNVQHVYYEIHKKTGSPDSLKAMYKTDAQWAMEWICFQHPKDFPRQKAAQWWRARGGLMPVPQTAMDAYIRLKEINKIKAKRIKVRKNGKFTEISAYDLGPADPKETTQKGNLGALHANSA